MNNSGVDLRRDVIEKPLNLSDKVSKYKFPLIAFFFSLYAWFPKIQTSLNPQFYIPADVTHSLVQPHDIPFVHAFKTAKIPHLLIYKNKSYSLLELPSNITICASSKASILPSPRKKVEALAENLGLDYGPPLQVYSYQLCLDQTYITKRRSLCDSKFLIIDSKLKIVSSEFDLRERYAVDLLEVLQISLRGCKVRDVTVRMDVVRRSAIVFVTFAADTEQDEQTKNAENKDQERIVKEKLDESSKCPTADYFLIKFNLETGDVLDAKTISSNEKFREWSKYSASLHGFIHSWKEYKDSRVLPRFLMSNHDLLMKEEATRISQGSRPTIRDVFQGSEFNNQFKSLYLDEDVDVSLLKDTSRRQLKHNSYFIHFSEGVLIVKNDTLEPITFLGVPSNARNHTVNIVWDQDVRSVASVDIGSTLKTIGIPRIFAECRIVGQTEPLYQKLLSVQDLVGMTIEESLEEMKFLQPPLVFTPGKASKFDHTNVLTSGRLSNDPKFMFHIGYGTIKCYDLEGVLVWKSETKAKWQSKLKFLRADRTLHSLFKPSIKPIVSMNAFLFQGYDHVSIISQLNGQELGSHNLPSIPIADPVLFDYNMDGVEDVIVITRNGIIAFTLCSTMSNVQFWVFYVAATFASFLLFLATNIHWFNTTD